MNTTEIEKRLDIALLASKKASEVLLRHFNNTKISQKDTSFNIVTEADLESEKVIIELIKKNFPQDSILAEESSKEIKLEERTWIVDPLDGTNNFAHGIPQFAVSIAFYLNGEAKLGVVYNPITNELFSAVENQGSKLNGKNIKVSQSKSLKTSIICTGFYYDRGSMMKNTLNSIEEFFTSEVHGIRRFGAASLDLCFVASGRLDGYYEFKLAPWDFGAGALILKEAGGMVSNCLGSSLKAEFSGIVASNNLIHEDMIAIVKKHQN